MSGVDHLLREGLFRKLYHAAFVWFKRNDLGTKREREICLPLQSSLSAIWSSPNLSREIYWSSSWTFYLLEVLGTCIKIVTSTIGVMKEAETEQQFHSRRGVMTKPLWLLSKVRLQHKESFLLYLETCLEKKGSGEFCSCMNVGYQ